MPNFIWKIYTKLLRIWISFSNNPRPSSAPYISGDGFRSLAHHIYDDMSNFDPKSVKEGEIIFVQSNKIDSYFEKLHLSIPCAYKLITHNSDRNITKDDLKYIDDKIIRWFAVNVTVYHPKLIPIPIGLENKRLAYAGIPWVFDKMGHKTQGARGKTQGARKNKILVNFSISTNPVERAAALYVLTKNPQAEKLGGWPNQYKYAKILSNYKYVASPPGNGVDCHRTWEALYLGTIPIVKSSVCMEYFKNLGLPLLIVQDWVVMDINVSQEINEVQKVRKILTLDYWKKKIYES